MRGIAKGAEIGIVWRHDVHFAALAHQAMKLFHGADDVRYMLDDVNGLQRVKGTVAKRVGKAVELTQNIGPAGRVAIDADRARLLVDPAADVENSHANPRLSLKRPDCGGTDCGGSPR